MKELFLVRHAKSSWKDPFLEDIQRPLSERGKKDAPFMSRLLVQAELRPDAIFSSPALRAFTTAKIFATELDIPKNRIIVDESIYASGVRQLFSILKKMPEQANRVMLIGHNPELTEFCNFIAGAGIENIQTCALVGIKMKIERWNEVDENCGELFYYEYPKKYLKIKSRQE